MLNCGQGWEFRMARLFMLTSVSVTARVRLHKSKKNTAQAYTINHVAQICGQVHNIVYYLCGVPAELLFLAKYPTLQIMVAN